MLFLFAGKAHPADEPAQWMMREIQRISSQPPFIGKILLLEGYDMGISRLLDVGRGRVAQHAGAPIRGERHVRHEGRDQRHGELERARRLVGRGLRRPRRAQERLGHSAGVDTQGAADRDHQDAIDALRDSAGRSDPALLRARPPELGLFAGLGRAVQALDGVDPAARSTTSGCCATICSRFYVPAAKQGRAVAAAASASRAISPNGRRRCARLGPA